MRVEIKKTVVPGLFVVRRQRRADVDRGQLSLGYVVAGVLVRLL